MEKIKIELTVNEANTILESLGNLPFIQVADLIQNIQQQAAAQLDSTTGLQRPSNGVKSKSDKKNELVEETK